MSRIWNRIDRNIYPLCAFPGHKRGGFGIVESGRLLGRFQFQFKF